MSSEIKYRPDIDGLRAIAVIAVVFFHAFPTMLTGGFVGVDVFFVISGYLISTILIRQLSEGRFSFKSFYIKRINRIFPALVLVLIFCFIFGWFALFSNELKELGKHIAGGSGFVSNIVLWDEFGYFDKASGLKPLLHLWSLAIEEQFYLIWPLILWYSFKRKFNLLVVLSSFAFASFFLNLLLYEFDRISTFYLLPTRFWELLAGSYLAYSVTFKKEFIKIHAFNNLKATCGILLIVIAVIFFNPNHLYPGYRALLPTIGTVLLISAGSGAWFNRKILSAAPLVWIGVISYPLYLWHWPVLSFLHIVNSGEKIANTSVLIALAGSFLLAWVTNRFLENPVKFNKENNKLALMFFLLMTAVGTLGMYTYLSPPQRLNSSITEVENHNGLLKEIIYKDSCVPEMGKNSLDYCMLTEKDKIPTVALIGDSHANALYFGLSSVYKNMGENLLLMGKGTCVPFLNVESGMVGSIERCRKDMNFAIEYALHSTSIKTIILASRGSLYITGKGYHERRPDNYLRYSGLKGEKNYADIFQQAMKATMNELVKSGKKIIIIQDNPELSFNPEICLRPRPFSSFKNPKSPCDSSNNDEFKKRNQEYNSILSSMESVFPSATFFDPHKYFCDEKSCHAIIEGKLMFRDNNHLSRDGVVFFAEKFKEAVYK